MPSIVNSDRGYTAATGTTDASSGILPDRIAGVARLVQGATVVTFGYQVAIFARRAKPGYRAASILPLPSRMPPRGISSSTTMMTGVFVPPSPATADGSLVVTSVLTGVPKRNNPAKRSGAGLR